MKICQGLAIQSKNISKSMDQRPLAIFWSLECLSEVVQRARPFNLLPLLVRVMEFFKQKVSVLQ
jgi:hypothetical protein